MLLAPDQNIPSHDEETIQICEMKIKKKSRNRELLKYYMNIFREAAKKKVIFLMAGPLRGGGKALRKKCLFLDFSFYFVAF